MEDAARSFLRALTAVNELPAQRAVWVARLGTLSPEAAEQVLRAAAFGSAAASRGALVLASWSFAERRAGSVRLQQVVAGGPAGGLLQQLFRRVPARRELAALGRLPEVSVPTVHSGKLRFQGEPGWGRFEELPCNLHLSHQLLRHPSAWTVGRVLRQPWVRVAHALEVASRRPSSATIVDQLLEDRWLREPAIRRALVRNPFTPGVVALPLLPTVHRSVWRELALVEPGPLSDAAQRLLSFGRQAGNNSADSALSPLG